jgi:hypothetical protein
MNSHRADNLCGPMVDISERSLEETIERALLLVQQFVHIYVAFSVDFTKVRCGFETSSSAGRSVRPRAGVTPSTSK